MKDIASDLEAANENGVKTKADLTERLPLIVELQDAVKNLRKLMREVSAILDEANEQTGEYVLEHQSVFDDGLNLVRDGTYGGDITIDDVTYHFVKGAGEPKYEGGNLTQGVLKKLPDEWVKSKLVLNVATVDDEALEEYHLVRPDKYEWSAKE